MLIRLGKAHSGPLHRPKTTPSAPGCVCDVSRSATPSASVTHENFRTVVMVSSCSGLLRASALTLAACESTAGLPTVLLSLCRVNYDADQSTQDCARRPHPHPRRLPTRGGPCGEFTLNRLPFVRLTFHAAFSSVSHLISPRRLEQM